MSSSGPGRAAGNRSSPNAGTPPSDRNNSTADPRRSNNSDNTNMVGASGQRAQRGAADSQSSAQGGNSSPEWMSTDNEEETLQENDILMSQERRELLLSLANGVLDRLVRTSGMNVPEQQDSSPPRPILTISDAEDEHDDESDIMVSGTVIRMDEDGTMSNEIVSRSTVLRYLLASPNTSTTGRPIRSASASSNASSMLTDNQDGNHLEEDGDDEEASMQSSDDDRQDTLTRLYINQLLFGCQRDICENPFCANNPNFSLTGASEVSHIAQTLARLGPQNLCNGNQPNSAGNADAAIDPMQDIVKELGSSHLVLTEGATTTANGESIRPLTYTIIKEQVEACKATENYTSLQRLLFSNFSTLSLLSQCFRKSQGVPEVGTGGTIVEGPHKTVLSTIEMNLSFSQILQCPTAVMNSVVAASTSLLDKIKLGKVELKEEGGSLDALIVLISNPILMDSTYHTSFLARLVDVLVNLRPQLQLAFTRRWFQVHAEMSWEEAKTKLSQLPDNQKVVNEEMNRVVSVLQHLITMRIYTLTTRQNGTPPVLNTDLVIVDATKCLALFYEINAELELVPYGEFYNEAVNEQMDIKDDFPHWKAKDGFSFCNYPFILNPAVKSDILKVESMVQMRHELQDAFFRAMFIGVNSPYLVLEIRRDHIIRDALYQLEARKPQDLKKQLKIQFVGEEGVDEGGVQKEFFQLVVRELFDAKYGIFKWNEESHLYWFADIPFEDAQFEQELRLVGRLLGLAIYNGVILDVHFPLALYKKIMNKSVGFKDLESLDPMLHRNLKMLLEYDGDVESVFGRTFQIDVQQFGETLSHDLCPNGANINLTNANRQEFVRLYADFILNKSIAKSFDAFKEGFDMVCQGTAIRLFLPEEVEILLCGSADLDFEALQKATTYDGGFTEETPVIKHFWEIVSKFDDSQKKKLLFFATGTDRVPIGGLAKLNFVIAKNGPDSDRLPSSHTCFNVLLLPEYTKKDKLEERLLTAIQNSEGFGMI